MNWTLTQSIEEKNLFRRIRTLNQPILAETTGLLSPYYSSLSFKTAQRKDPLSIFIFLDWGQKLNIHIYSFFFLETRPIFPLVFKVTLSK